jgi:hypothetical protein
MGLETFYDLHAPVQWSRDRVRDVVQSVHKVALGVGFAAVDQVRANDVNDPRTLIAKESPPGHDYVHAQAIDGWFFRTWPGPGCETAHFGLCHFPETVVVEGKEFPMGWGEGWHYHTWCKTQYADRVSRDHFLRSHLGVVAILDAFRARGVEVNARDASGYWEHRDRAELERQVDEWNRIVAAVAGAIKDATEEVPGCVASPIFAAPDFEHLEAEGHAVIRRKRKRQP